MNLQLSLGCGGDLGHDGGSTLGSRSHRARRRAGIVRFDAGQDLELVRHAVRLGVSQVEVVVEVQGSTVRGLCEFIAGRGSGGVERAGSLGAEVVTAELGGVLASESQELVAGRTLGNLDGVLVEPTLELAVAPRVEELAAEVILGVHRDG